MSTSNEQISFEEEMAYVRDCLEGTVYDEGGYAIPASSLPEEGVDTQTEFDDDAPF